MMRMLEQRNVQPASNQAAASNLPPPSSNATLSRGPDPGTWGARRSAELKEQYERDKQMAANAYADPFATGVVHTTFGAANQYVKGVAEHGYGVYEGIEEKNGWKIAGNTVLLGLDVSPFVMKGSGGLSRLENNIVNEANTIINSKEFEVIQNAVKTNMEASVTIGKRIVNYNPETAGSAITLHESPFFEGCGFQLGKAAFKSPNELKKTLIHELFRLNTQATNQLGVDVTRQYTDAAVQAAEKLYQFVKTKQ